MNSLVHRFRQSPIAVRAAPYLLLVLLTFLQGKFGAHDTYWLYLLKTILGALLLVLIWPAIQEMRWKLSAAAVVVGVAVAVMWIGLGEIVGRSFEAWTPRFASTEPWNPLVAFAANAGLAWFFIVVRVAGSTLVVPPLEEVFFRSLLYRYLIKAEFLRVSLGQFAVVPFIVTAVIFASGHAPRDWPAGVLCGLAYQGLVCWKKRLGDAITAHAITNFLLGCYVVWKPAWYFW